MKLRGSVRFVIAGLGCAALLGSCREPTEITLQVHTNLPCKKDSGNWYGVAVYVGKPGAALEHAAPTLETDACEPNGRIGSLVVVPSGSKSEELGVRVVAGLSRKPDDCAAKGYQGCIVARRALRFTPHTPLDLDIALDADCVDVGCDPTHTCLTGGCVGSEQVEHPDPEDVREPSVRCGDNGVRCGLTGKVCCLSVDTDAQTTHGECRYPETCPSDSAVLNCDDDSDCPPESDYSYPGLCMLVYDNKNGVLQDPGRASGSQCRFAANTSTQSSAGLALCENRLSCANGWFVCKESKGMPNPLPGYHWCEWTL